MAYNDHVLDSDNIVVKILGGRGLNFASFMSSSCGTRNFLSARQMWPHKNTLKADYH